MSPKMRVSPMPSKAYVPPSTRPYTRCWSSTSIRARSPVTLRRRLLLGLELRQRHLPVPDLDDEDARLALAALLAGGAVLVELDRAVDAGDVDLPEGVADGLGLGRAR